jgi:[ribosomal protein S5]-alanine N-acetyltransferase
MQRTARLAIEPLTEAHAPEAFKVFQDARLYAYIPESAPGSLHGTLAEYRGMADGAPADSEEQWLNWALRCAQSRQFVGTLQATVYADGRLWVAYKLAPSFWGRGLASEALRWLVEELGLRFEQTEILAAVDTRNSASIRVLEKSGFRRNRKAQAELHGLPTEDYVYCFVGDTDPAQAGATTIAFATTRSTASSV